MTAPTDAVGADEVRKVAELARLDLAPGDLARLAADLASVVGYVARLREIDTAGVEPLAHALPVANVFRDDEPAAPLGADDALANAPAVRQNADGRFYAVPAVLE